MLQMFKHVLFFFRSRKGNMQLMSQRDMLLRNLTQG